MTTTQAPARLDFPRMLGRAEGALISTAGYADACAECLTSEARLRAALREVAAMARRDAALSSTEPIHLEPEE